MKEFKSDEETYDQLMHNLQILENLEYLAKMKTIQKFNRIGWFLFLAILTVIFLIWKYGII